MVIAVGVGAGAAAICTIGAAVLCFFTETFNPSVSMLTSANGDLAI